VSFAAITLCVASQRVFIVVSVYFVIDSVRKLLDTRSYFCFSLPILQLVVHSCERNEHESDVQICVGVVFERLNVM
jgi:hypothetical protein